MPLCAKFRHFLVKKMKFTLADLHFLGQLLALVARQEIVPRFKRLPAIDSRQKTSSFDIVTEADEVAEAAIQSELASRYPGASFIGEEASARDPTLLTQIGSAELAFIIDPLDGTKNFASGLPLFGTMVAVTVRGAIVGSAIHDPIRADTAYALADGGAWLENESGQRRALTVSACKDLGEMHCIIGTNFMPQPLRAQVNARLSQLGMSMWFRCAAHEYRLAASGHVDALFYNKLMPWDHAAGWLLHREAGGFSAHFDGTAYSPTHTSGGLICASDEESFHCLQSALLRP